jgi:hypothetical protein
MTPRPKSYPKVERRLPSVAQKHPDAKNRVRSVKSLIFHETGGKGTDFSRSREIEIYQL